MDITVVIPYRPYEKYDNYLSLEKVVDSIREQSLVPEVIVSVYGDYDERLKNLEVKVVHELTEEPWNRSLALNRGTRKATGEVVFTCDADCRMIKEDTVLEIHEAVQSGKHVVYRVKFGKNVNTHGAGLQGNTKKWFLENPWDEGYVGYGREDIHMLKVAEKDNQDIVELSGGIAHIKHPKANKDAEIKKMWQKNTDRFNKIWG